MIGCSYLNGYRLADKKEYKDVVVEAAKSLSTRFRPGAGVIQSWDADRGWQGTRGWKCPVIIDNMMNLELLFEATAFSGDSTFYDIAVKHADTTMAHHFRPDNSCYHVVDYLVMLGLYALGVLIGILAALIMNKTAFRGKPVPFVMELPNYRMPGLKSVALLLWEKAKDFLQRAFTVIFLATIIIWFLQSFDTRLNVVADSAASLLALIGRWIAPIFRPLGFGDWRCATALISGFIAKESVVSTLQVLLGGAAISSLLTTRSAISFLVFTLLYTPCVAAIATIRRELDSRLKTVGVVLLQCTVAWIVACAAYAIAGLV